MFFALSFFVHRKNINLLENSFRQKFITHVLPKNKQTKNFINCHWFLHFSSYTRFQEKNIFIASLDAYTEDIIQVLYNLFLILSKHSQAFNEFENKMNLKI